MRRPTRRYSADAAGQIEASRARLAGSRRISRQTEVLIRESQETIKRSRERLEQPDSHTKP
jgi:transposase-like protein